jgi:DNA-binding CsgD family transcriptional regulator
VRLTIMDGEEQRIARLISQVYGALLGNGSWQLFLDSLSSVLPNGKATLFYHDTMARTGAFSLHSQFEPERIEAYSRYFCAKNPWMPKAIARPLDIGVRAEQMLLKSELVRTEFYTDFMRPQKLESAVGVTLFRDQGCNFMLSILHGSASDAEAQTAASLLGTLAPHLREAFSYYRRAGVIASSAAAACDILGVGILAIGPDRRVRWSNAPGQGLVSSGDPVGTNACGRVTSAHPQVRETIDLTLKLAMAGQSTGPRTVIVPARDDAQSVIRLTIMVPSQSECERYFVGPSITVLIERVGPCGPLVEQYLRDVFRLTPAEARLANALADGATLAATAARQGISKETARTTLKRIFAKVGVSRQAELVAKLHRLGYRYSVRFP